MTNLQSNILDIVQTFKDNKIPMSEKQWDLSFMNKY